MSGKGRLRKLGANAPLDQTRINRLAEELRAQFMRSVVRKLEQAERPCLLLSGGVDSTMLAATLYRLGRQCPTLTVAYGPYENQDVRLARRTATALFPSYPHEVIHVDRSLEHLTRHAREAIRFAGCVRKTLIEVTVLTWAAIRRARELGCDAVLVGAEAGALWGYDSHSHRALARSQRDWHTSRLNDVHLNDCVWPLSANMAGRHYAESLGLRWLDPYLDHDLIEWYMGVEYAEVNVDRGKGLAHRAFPELLRLKPEVYSMQSRAGVPAAAEIMTKERGVSSSLLYYNRLGREEGIALDGSETHLKYFSEREDQAFMAFIHQLIRKLNNNARTDYRPPCVYEGETVG
jgi:asparagine synthetase B (glutamine-hydrolysing)